GEKRIDRGGYCYFPDIWVVICVHGLFHNSSLKKDGVILGCPPHFVSAGKSLNGPAGVTGSKLKATSALR
ncbi:MAG: hypothetical protein OEY09_12850, partial [Gammaproteobacteria bacterium]|nr:hypothetical protein [Gammaproteobacteria bacterium]